MVETVGGGSPTANGNPSAGSLGGNAADDKAKNVLITQQFQLNGEEEDDDQEDFAGEGDDSDSGESGDEDGDAEGDDTSNQLFELIKAEPPTNYDAPYSTLPPKIKLETIKVSKSKSYFQYKAVKFAYPHFYSRNSHEFQNLKYFKTFVILTCLCFFVFRKM